MVAQKNWFTHNRTQNGIFIADGILLPKNRISSKK